MSRSMGLDRVVEFFRTTDLDVAEITLMHVSNIVGNRRKREQSAVESQAKTLLPPVRRRGKSRKGASLSTVVSSQVEAKGPSQESLADA